MNLRVAGARSCSSQDSSGTLSEPRAVRGTGHEKRHNQQSWSRRSLVFVENFFAISKKVETSLWFRAESGLL
jgi:hypothetical protein